MPGPTPKAPEMRQRRNRTSTAATLPSESGRRAPPLHKHSGAPECDWHPMTRAWWRDVWRSPMAAEFLKADVHGLYLLAELVDRFWLTGDTELAKEIRLQRQCFGLTPIDRRRLQWEVPQERKTRKSERTPPTSSASAGPDPRAALRAIK